MSGKHFACIFFFCSIYFSTYSQPGDSTRILTPAAEPVGLHVAKDNVNCLYGLKNKEGKWVVEPVYTYISEQKEDYSFYSNFNNACFKVVINNMTGLLSPDGKMLVPPVFDDVSGVIKIGNSQFIRFRKHSFYGLFNIFTQKEILPAEYDWVNLTDHKKFIFRKKELDGLADSNGVILPARYSNLMELNSAGYYTFRQVVNDTGLNKSGVINLKGDTIIPAGFEFCSNLTVAGRPKFIWAVNHQGEKRYCGIYDTKGRQLLPVEYNPEDWYLPYFPDNGSPLILKKNGRYELLDTNGHIISGDLDTIQLLNKPGIRQYGKAEAIYRKNGLYGIMDIKGNPLIPLAYEFMSPLTNRTDATEDPAFTYHFIVRKKKKYGIINEENSTVYPMVYDLIFESGEYVYFIKDGYLEMKRRMDYTDTDLSQLHFYGSVARFCTGYWSDGNCGFVNDSGRVLLMPAYQIGEFAEHKAYFSDREGVRGFCTDNGKIEFRKKTGFRSIGIFKDGYASVISVNGKMGVVDKDGKLVVDTLYDAITDFDAVTGTCWVKPEIDYDSSGEMNYDVFPDYGSWGLVNGQGKVLLEAGFYRPAFFTNDRAVLWDNTGLYGLVNKSGDTLIPFIYDDIRLQYNGMYMIMRDMLWGLADSNGQIIVDPAWINATDFLGDYAVVETDSFHTHLVDKKGNLVYDFEKTYNYRDLYLADSLFEFQYEDGAGNPIFKSIRESIEHYDLVDSLHASAKKRLISNRVLTLQCHNILATERGTESYPDAHFDNEKFNPNIYWYADRDRDAEEVSYSLSVMNVNKNSFSVDQVTTEYYYFSGMGTSTHFRHQYTNYGFRGDSLFSIRMDDLFVKGYEPALNSALVKAMKTIDDPNIDCTNPEAYLEHMKESFTVSPKGLIFYIQAGEDIEVEYTVEMLLPYSVVKGIINKKSVLSEFVK